jgi:hypothetical protein
MPGSESFPTHEEIEARAYEIYLTRRYADALEDWLTAEEQLIQEYAPKHEKTKACSGYRAIASGPI